MTQVHPSMHFLNWFRVSVFPLLLIILVLQGCNPLRYTPTGGYQGRKSSHQVKAKHDKKSNYERKGIFSSSMKSKGNKHKFDSFSKDHKPQKNEKRRIRQSNDAFSMRGLNIFFKKNPDHFNEKQNKAGNVSGDNVGSFWNFRSPSFLKFKKQKGKLKRPGLFKKRKDPFTAK